jgi:hypothetical protein
MTNLQWRKIKVMDQVELAKGLVVGQRYDGILFSPSIAFEGRRTIIENTGKYVMVNCDLRGGGNAYYSREMLELVGYSAISQGGVVSKEMGNENELAFLDEVDPFESLFEPEERPRVVDGFFA